MNWLSQKPSAGWIRLGLLLGSCGTIGGICWFLNSMSSGRPIISSVNLIILSWMTVANCGNSAAFRHLRVGPKEG